MRWLFQFPFCFQLCESVLCMFAVWVELEAVCKYLPIKRTLLVWTKGPSSPVFISVAINRCVGSSRESTYEMSHKSLPCETIIFRTENFLSWMWLLSNPMQIPFPSIFLLGSKSILLHPEPPLVTNATILLWVMQTTPSSHCLHSHYY